MSAAVRGCAAWAVLFHHRDTEETEKSGLTARMRRLEQTERGANQINRAGHHDDAILRRDGTSTFERGSGVRFGEHFGKGLCEIADLFWSGGARIISVGRDDVVGEREQYLRHFGYRFVAHRAEHNGQRAAVEIL